MNEVKSVEGSPVGVGAGAEDGDAVQYDTKRRCRMLKYGREIEFGQPRILTCQGHSWSRLCTRAAVSLFGF